MNIFLDLDGTLIDPKEGITKSIQYALKEMGGDVLSSDELEFCIGPPLYETFPTLLGEGADIDQAIAFYRERFIEEGVYEAEPYDGVGEMFEAFLNMDANLYIATSKPHAYANTVIDHFGISAYVQHLFGSELDGTRADKTSLLQYALDETGALPDQSIMIGDRRHDIFGAKNNDMLNIGALWGYGGVEELRMAEADMLASHPEEIPEIAIDLLGLE